MLECRPIHWEAGNFGPEGTLKLCECTTACSLQSHRTVRFAKIFVQHIPADPENFTFNQIRTLCCPRVDIPRGLWLFYFLSIRSASLTRSAQYLPGAGRSVQPLPMDNSNPFLSQSEARNHLVGFPEISGQGSVMPKGCCAGYPIS